MNLQPYQSRILASARALRPEEFEARIHYWRSGGFSSGSDEAVVATSFSHPIPVDENDGGLKDKNDREMQEALRVYRANLDDADRLLAACIGLERKWLIPIAEPDADAQKALETLVSDARSCMRCGKTKEVYERAQKKRLTKTAFRLPRGLCEACYKEFQRAGMPDIHAFCRKEQPASA